MKVADILRVKGRDVRTIGPGLTVADAVSRLAGPPPIGALVVSEDGRVPIGMLSERDIVRRLGTDGPRLLGLPIREVMSHHPVTCAPEDSLTEVAATMTRRRHRHLPVVSGGRLCGLVSIGDVLHRRMAEMQTETGVLRDMFAARH